MTKVQTNTNACEDYEQAFWAGIALENCIRAKTDKQFGNTADPLFEETADSRFTSAGNLACNTLYGFMMKKRLSYVANSEGGESQNWSSERHIRNLHDSTAYLTHAPGVCILPSPPPRPLVYVFDVTDDIKETLIEAISLANKHFTDVQTIDVRWEQDPEAGENWIAVEVTTKDEVDEVLEKYDNYTNEWVSLVPWNKRERIRLSYDII